jgi:hypothetical protein
MMLREDEREGRLMREPLGGQYRTVIMQFEKFQI